MKEYKFLIYKKYCSLLQKIFSVAFMHLTAAEAEAASLPCKHLSFMLQLRNEITQKMQSEEHKNCGKGLEGGIGKAP